MTIHAVDFGTAGALCVWGPNGMVPKSTLRIPTVPGGKTRASEFPLILSALLGLGDVAVESPSVGSSGAEPDSVKRVVESSGSKLWVISARAVKNYNKDNGIDNYDSKVEHWHAAKVLYEIAATQPYRMKLCCFDDNPLKRVHTSVRPMDERGYRDERSEQFMSMMPPFYTLPFELQHLLGNDDYSRAMVMPFVMATTEPFVTDGFGTHQNRRDRYMKIVGAYEHGFPSFYRRAWVDWIQEVARHMAGVGKMEDVSRETRRRAEQVSQRQVRTLFHLMMAWQEDGWDAVYKGERLFLRMEELPKSGPPAVKRMRGA